MLTLEDFNKAYQLDLSETEVKLSLADRFIAVNEVEKAKSLLDKVYESEPQNTRYWMMRSILALNSGSKEQMSETAKDGEAFAKWGDNLVAVYPEEGTLWSDHPIVRLNASWVSPEQQFAAQEFETFLMSKEIQKQSIPFGFRPGNETIVNDTDIVDEMSSVFTVENGVSLEVNIPRFTVPTDGEVLDRVPDVWLKTRG